MDVSADDQVLGGGSGSEEYVPRSAKRAKASAEPASKDPSRLLTSGPPNVIPAPPAALATRGFSEMFPDFTRLESLNFPGFGIDDSA